MIIMNGNEKVELVGSNVSITNRNTHEVARFTIDSGVVREITRVRVNPKSIYKALVAYDRRTA